MLLEGNKTFSYSADTTSSTEVIADGTDGTRVFYNLSWDTFYEILPNHNFALRLTSYGPNPQVSVIQNTCGFYHLPQDVKLSKIELLCLEPVAAGSSTLGTLSYSFKEIVDSSGKEELGLSNKTLSKRLAYFLKNTEDKEFFVRDGEQLASKLAELGCAQVQHYYDILYARNVGDQETDNKIIINEKEIEAAREWNRPETLAADINIEKEAV